MFPPWTLVLLSKQQSTSDTRFCYLLRCVGTRKEHDTPTSWYFLVTLLGTHWHSLQLWRQQAQFPPQRLTRRQPGQKMVSVLFSSSLMDTEKLRGVQLYSLTSSFSRFRSTTTWHKRKQRKIHVHALSLISFQWALYTEKPIWFTNNTANNTSSYFNEVLGLLRLEIRTLIL